MFNFIKEFSDLSGLPFSEVQNEHKVMLLGNRILWITNYVKILSYSNAKISLKIKGNVLHIEGLELYIKLLEKRELVIAGKINRVYLEKEFVGEKNEKVWLWIGI